MTLGCPECGALEELPLLQPRSKALCRICGFPLGRTAERSILAAFLCALAIFLLLIAANVTPLVTASLPGASRSEILGSGLAYIWGDGDILLASILGAFGLVLPL